MKYVEDYWRIRESQGDAKDTWATAFVRPDGTSYFFPDSEILFYGHLYAKDPNSGRPRYGGVVGFTTDHPASDKVSPVMLHERSNGLAIVAGDLRNKDVQIVPMFPSRDETAESAEKAKEIGFPIVDSVNGQDLG